MSYATPSLRSDCKLMLNYSKDIIRSLKNAAFGSVPVSGTTFSWVVIGADTVRNDDIILLLAKWRSENMAGFPCEELISVAGTRGWVWKQLVEREDRILFFLMDDNGRLVGHAGFSNIDFEAGICEFDNIIKGEKDAEKGLMVRACSVLIYWACDVLKIRSLWVKCFYDNFPAVALYHRLGFKPRELQPIRKIQEATCNRWIGITADKSFERFNLLLVNEDPYNILSNGLR